LGKTTALPCGQTVVCVFAQLKPWCCLFRLKKKLPCGMSNGTWTHSELIPTQIEVQQQLAQLGNTVSSTAAVNTVPSHTDFAVLFLTVLN
jgi:hypothetical protein